MYIKKVTSSFNVMNTFGKPRTRWCAPAATSEPRSRKRLKFTPTESKVWRQPDEQPVTQSPPSGLHGVPRRLGRSEMFGPLGGAPCEYGGGQHAFDLDCTCWHCFDEYRHRAEYVAVMNKYLKHM